MLNKICYVMTCGCFCSFRPSPFAKQQTSIHNPTLNNSSEREQFVQDNTITDRRTIQSQQLQIVNENKTKSRNISNNNNLIEQKQKIYFWK